MLAQTIIKMTITLQ